MKLTRVYNHPEHLSLSSLPKTADFTGVCKQLACSLILHSSSCHSDHPPSHDPKTGTILHPSLTNDPAVFVAGAILLPQKSYDARKSFWNQPASNNNNNPSKQQRELSSRATGMRVEKKEGTIKQNSKTGMALHRMTVQRRNSQKFSTVSYDSQKYCPPRLRSDKLRR